MSLDLPHGLRWLAWVAGTTWPDGDEDAMWKVSAAWKTASEDLKALLAEVDEAERKTMAAYPDGRAAEEMGKLFDQLRTGDQSIESLAELLHTVSDSTFDMGTELQSTKITVIVSLAWLAAEILWAWLFPPTAPAVEAAAISTTRSFLRVFEDFVANAIEKLAGKLGLATRAQLKAATGSSSRYFFKELAAGRFVLPTAKGVGVYSVKALESGVTSMGLNAAVQLGQMADGKRRTFNAKEFGASAVGSIAGTIPGREFARYAGLGLNKFAGDALKKMPGGSVLYGASIGAGSGVVGSVFGNLGAAAVTGDLSSFASPTGYVGGASRGAIVGGARGGFTKWTPISSSDPRFPFWMRQGAQNKPPSGPPAPPPASSSGSSSSSGDEQSFVTASSGGSFVTAPDGSAPRPVSSGGSFHTAPSSISSGSSSHGAPAPTRPGEWTGGTPPTSWSSSVDGGWRPSGARPTVTAGPAGSSHGGGSSGSSGSSTHSSSSSGTHPAPEPPAPEKELGAGKDMKAKTRPKQVPYIEPLPAHYDAPGAPRWQQWVPPEPTPDVDVAFRPPTE
ncbi:WXG100-like domain-containing protein [Nocardia sp. NPDC003482]